MTDVTLRQLRYLPILFTDARNYTDVICNICRSLAVFLVNIMNCTDVTLWYL